MEPTKQWLETNYGKPDKSEYDIDWDKLMKMLDRHTREALIEYYKDHNPHNRDYAEQVINEYLRDK